jgi:hypothetical protein
MRAIVVGQYVVSVPDQFVVEDYNQYRDMPDFLRGMPFDWNLVRQTPTVYSVRFGEQSLSFHALVAEFNPENLAEVVFNQTGSRPELEDVEINGIQGKSCGFFGDYSRKEWWLRADHLHVICFCFQGMGAVTQATESAIAMIMNTLRRDGHLN